MIGTMYLWIETTVIDFLISFYLFLSSLQKAEFFDEKTTNLKICFCYNRIDDSNAISRLKIFKYVMTHGKGGAHDCSFTWR